jgi:PadR family transcriptional regulator, regulatory protein PadR
MLAILHLADQEDREVYGVPIVDEIDRRTGRPVSRVAVYIALRRLERRGLVHTWMGAPVAERGGKARRCVKVTHSGLDALQDAREALTRMWAGLDPNLERNA